MLLLEKKKKMIKFYLEEMLLLNIIYLFEDYSSFVRMMLLR